MFVPTSVHLKSAWARTALSDITDAHHRLRENNRTGGVMQRLSVRQTEQEGSEPNLNPVTFDPEAAG